MVGWPQESLSSNNRIESGHRLVAASLGLNKYSLYFKTFINLAVNQSVNGIGAMQRRRNNTLERMMAYKPANIGCKYHAAKR